MFTVYSFEFIETKLLAVALFNFKSLMSKPVTFSEKVAVTVNSVFVCVPTLLDKDTVGIIVS